MIILEAPYVSEFLQQSVIDLKIPVLKNEFVQTLKLANQMNLIEPTDFFDKIKNAEYPVLYSNSENSTVLLNQYIPESAITNRINFFKDKSKLRSLFKNSKSNIWYKSYNYNQLFEIAIETMQKPFVIKPLRGFASICIHSVFNNNDWQFVLSEIKKEIELMHNVFPDNVVSLQEFIIEQYVEGKEIAIDAYFNNNNEPVILNILHHLHNAPNDMSDRLYITSAEIVTGYYDGVYNYLLELSELMSLKNFPFHMEMILDKEGKYIPVEINPMRFMGFCVADVENYFYGINPYEYYFNQKKPDWNEILKTRKNIIYGMVGIDIPKHLNKNTINFNYDKFISYFTNPIHYTKMDYKKFPMAIYLYAQVDKTNFKEFEHILFSDLQEFIDEIQ